MKYELPDGILAGKRSTEEYHLHVACIDYLKGQTRHGKNTYPTKRPFPQLYSPCGRYQRFTHLFQGRGDPKEGYFNKLLGLRRGLLDIFSWPGFFGYIDIKIPGQGLTSDQEQFAADMRELGARTATASKVSDIRDIYIEWGLKCENRVCNEPPLSPAAKQKAYLDMMAPL